MTISIGESLFDPNGEPVTRLPVALQGEVDKASEAARNQPVAAPKKDVIPPS